MPRIQLLFAFSLLLLHGCAPWDSAGVWKSEGWLDQRPEAEAGERIQLPASRMAKESVTLEIAVGQLDLEQQEDLDQLWQEVDQQALPIEVRQRLDQNGFLAGLIASQPPTTARICSLIVSPARSVLPSLLASPAAALAAR